MIVDNLLQTFLTILTVSASFDLIYGVTHDFDSEESGLNHDLAVWSSISTSLANWSRIREQKKGSKDKRSLKRHRSRRDEEVVCYRNFGCFRDEGAFDYLDTLPASPQDIGTVFTLYTRKNPMEGEVLDFEKNATLHASRFNASHPVKIIIHGFGSSGKRPWVLQMTEALLYTEELNVVIVDWEKGAALPNYVQAAANTQLVGKQIALLIKMINFETKRLVPKDYHLIGFSLGAHIAGFTGMEIRNLSRITGLDPASPLFEGYPERVRLDPTDANFVDVIHSNGDGFLRGGLGSYEPMGHLDFYPNGGRVQVGCNSVFMGAISDIFYGKWQSLCHHRRAFRFFIDSVVPSCKFHSFGCETYEKFLRGDCFDCGKEGRNCSYMGYYAHQSIGRGKMYLVTREGEPFCANQFKINMVNTIGQGSTWGKLEMTFIAKDANETFTLTSESDEIRDEATIQGLVVAHPMIRNVTHVMIKYTRYRGWIYTGKEIWGIDKIALRNSDGETVSYCGFKTILEDTVSLTLELVAGNCSVSLPPPVLPSQRIARLIWKVVSGPIKGRPPRLLWRIAIDPHHPMEGEGEGDEEGEETQWKEQDMNYLWQTLR